MATTDSFRRTVILAGSVIVALSAGTNYVYSAYAPQMGHRLHMNHAQLNVIGFGGNAGNYLAGPFWGRAVDKHGPKLLLISSFCCLLVGYSAVRAFYDGTFSLPTSPSSTLTPAVVALAFLQFITGVGGNAGITASLNTTAKSFPDRSRATVTGLVISGFGLSAFLFGGIAHIAFPGNTSDFLLLLAFGTAIPPLIGAFFLRPVPHAELPDHTEPIVAGGTGAAVEAFTPIQGPDVYERLDDYEVSGSDSEEESGNTGRDASQSSRGQAHEVSPKARGDGKLSRFASFSDVEPAMGRRMSSESGLLSFGRKPSYGQAPPPGLRLSSAGEWSSPERAREDATEDATLIPKSHRRLSGHGRHTHATISHPDIHGMALLKSGDFWLIFGILSLLSGTGLMWINNVGSITQALYIKGEGKWDEVQGSKEQAFQVSITSLGNCLGRVLIGLTADFVRNRYHAPRVLLCTFISISFILSQIVAGQIDSVMHLWMASALIGLSYGAVFGLLPVITIEWFGLGSFSQNWGFVSIAPVLSGNLFSLAFGKNLDAHASNPSGHLHGSVIASGLELVRRGGLPSELLCYEGRSCYVDSLKITIVACLIAFGLSVFAVYRDRRRTKSTRVVSQVVWDDGASTDAGPDDDVENRR